MKYFIYEISVLVFLLNCLSAPKKVEKQEVVTSTSLVVAARITAKPILNLWESPSINGKILDSIPENYIVYTMAQTTYKESIANHEDYWYKTQYKNKIGWVFGKYLDFTEQEISVSKAIQASSKIPQYHANFKKIRNFFDANMSQKNYKQFIAEFGKPANEVKFKGSNPHGGFNSFIEATYPDFRLIFIDQFLFDMTFFTSEKLKNKTIQIGSALQDLELEFETPFYMSKDQFSYLTCIPHSDECPTGYPNTIHFKLEDQKVKLIRLTMYLD